MTNVKGKTTSVAKMRLARTQTDLTDATAILASLETDTTAPQISLCSIYGADGLKGSDSLNQAIASKFCKEGKTKKVNSMSCKRILGKIPNE